MKEWGMTPPALREGTTRRVTADMALHDLVARREEETLR
jgi:hypothetical protein